MKVDERIKRLADVGHAMRYMKAGAERERWPRERLEQWRSERLRELVAHARGHSPFWRERLAGLPEPLALTDLPVLDKTTMMERWDDLVTDRRLRRDQLLEHVQATSGDELYLGEFRAMTTSGSSGRKGLFVYDRPAWRRLMAQFLRYTDWLGSKPRIPRLRVAAIGPTAAAHMSARCARTLDVGFHRIVTMPATTPLPEIVHRLNEFQPDVLNAYPSVAAMLAAEQEAGRLRLRLKWLSTSSELRTRELAERLEAAFGVKPLDLYATTEGLWGCECEERDGIHLFEDGAIVENVDADHNPVAPGQPGAAVLVTNLFNRAQPLIRFELADVFVLDPEPCRCGRTLQRLRAVEGRADDVLDIGGVTVLPAQFGLLTADPAVRQFQVVQSGSRLRLRLVLADGADPQPEAARIAAAVADRLRALGIQDPDVVAEPCREIERRNGKIRLVVADPGLTAAA